MVGSRHEVHPQLLRKRADQRDHQVLAQARHLPGERVALDAVQGGDREVHRDAVGRGSRLELVGQRERQVALVPAVRVVGLVDGGDARVDQHLRVEGEQVGLALPGALPPRVEVRTRDDVCPDARVVEVEQRVLVDEDVAAAGAVLELLDLLEQRAVLREEPVTGLPLAVDEGVPDEQLAGHRRVDLAVGHEPVGDEGHAVQRHALVGHDGRALLGPVRLGPGPLHEVLAEPFGPLRPDRRVDPPPETGGLHQLGGHHQLRLLLEQAGPGEDREAGVARAEVVAPVGVAQPDVREQPGQQRLVDRVGVRGVGGVSHVELELLGHLTQLRLELLPLADAEIVEVLRLAHAPERARRQGALLLPDVAPQVRQRHEVRGLVAEPRVCLVRLGPEVRRPLAWVLDGERGGDDQHLPQAAEPVGLDDHPRETRVDREYDELATEPGQPAAWVLLAGVEGAELLEELDAGLHVPLVRRVDEREAGHVTEAQGGHLEDDRGEVGPEDLGVGELRPALEVLLRVQPDADAGLDPAAPALALVGRRLADRLDRQALHLGAERVARDAGEAGVDDVADARDGQRRLGDVRRQHHPALGVALEHLVLLGAGEPGVQRHDVELVHGPLRPDLAQHVGGVPDLLLPREEHQDVAGALVDELLDRLDDRLGLVLDHDLTLSADVGVVVRLLDQRPVAELDRVGTPRDLDDRRRGAVRSREVLREPLGVDGGRGDDHLEVRPLRQQLLEVPDDEVDVEAALVGLVDDQGVVGREHPVVLQLVEQDAVGHQLDQGVRARLVGEPDLVAHGAAELGAELLGDPLGDASRGDPAGLGVTDQTVHATTELEADLGKLGGLPRPGLAGDDHDLVVPDGGGDVLAPLGDGEVRRVVDRRHQRLAGLDLLGGEPVASLLRPPAPVVAVARRDGGAYPGCRRSAARSPGYDAPANRPQT